MARHGDRDVGLGAPPAGCAARLRGDGPVVGSVSGGCVEDDLIDRVRHGERVETPSLVTYGVTKEEAARFGLPCGGQPAPGAGAPARHRWVDDILERTARHELVARRLDLAHRAA
jgi:xanthine dehydrogenase accessory factor